MLPLPTVEASAVDSAWNGVIVPSAERSFLKAPFRTMRRATGNRRIWMTPVRNVMSPPTMSSTAGMSIG